MSDIHTITGNNSGVIFDSISGATIYAADVDINVLGCYRNLQTYLLENESKIARLEGQLTILQCDNQQLARKLDEVYYRRGVSY